MSYIPYGPKITDCVYVFVVVQLILSLVQFLFSFVLFYVKIYNIEYKTKENKNNQGYN